MGLEITEVQGGNITLLSQLYGSMQAYYGEKAADPAIIENKLAAALPLLGSGFILMAIEEQPLGFATVAPLFPASNLEITWFLKDLYAIPDARGRGVGKALMRAVARKIIQAGGQRLDFTTDNENSGARGFYRNLEIGEVGKVYYRCDADNLKKLAE